MAKLDLKQYSDNEFLESFFELKNKVENTDITQLSDDELLSLYTESSDKQKYYNGLQMTVKDLANSMYGAMGSEFFRFYNPEVAADITTEGKLFMFVVDDTINNYFHTWESDPTIEQELKNAFPEQANNIKITNVKNPDICVYGDTDSRYVIMGDVIKACGYIAKTPKQACDFVVFMENTRIKKLIRDNLYSYIEERNGKHGLMIMELEVIGGRGIFLKKKKYVISKFWEDGKLIADKGKIKSTGVEIQQTATTQFVKSSIKVILHKLLTPGTKTSDIYKMGVAIVNRAKAAPIDELINATGISDYTKYVVNDTNEIVINQGAQAHVRAAAEYNSFLFKNNLLDKFPKYIGGKIFWYYAMNKSGVFGVPDGVNVADLPNAPEMDYQKQVEKLIINPIKRYLFNTEIDSSTFGDKNVLFSFNSFKKV